MTYRRDSGLKPADLVARVGPSDAADWEREVATLAERLGVAPSLQPDPSWLVAKRAVDIVLGSALAVLAIPVIVVLAVCVAARFRTWPFFVHKRVTRGGRIFPFPKLRTLPRNTPKYASKYDLPRDVGRLSRFMRNAHLDELPQLLTVPLGWMSLVGPRPLMPHDFATAPRSYVDARICVPQGCTGLWQIGAHSYLLQQEAPEYDLFYTRHASFRLDLWILWRTGFQLLGLGPAIELEDVPGWALRRDRLVFEPDAAP